MPCSGFNGGSIEFETAESDFCAGAGDWAFPSSIICSPAAASRHAAADVDGDDRRPLSSSSSAGNATAAAAVGDAALAASTCVPHPQSVLMCLPHLDGAGSFTSTIPEMRDSSDSKFSKYRVDMTTSSKMEVEDESPPQQQQPAQGESGQAEGGRKSNRKDGGGGGGESKRVNAAGEEEEEDEEVVEEEVEEGDELFFQPPRRISMLWNSKLRWREERKKVLKISIAKLRRIEDPELSLCRAILINNTVKRLHREIREEKTSRYPDVIRPVPVPMVTAYHLASIPEAFPRKRSSSTHTSPPPTPSHSSPHSYDYALDSHYCNNDKENRNCSDSVVIDYMNIDSGTTALPTESVTTTPSPAKRARLTNSKSDVVSNVCYSTSSSETSTLMVDVNDYRSSDLRTAVTTSNSTSPLTCHQQQYQTSSTAFQTFSCTQGGVNGASQLLELSSETVTKSAKSDANSSSTQRTHLITLDCCTKDELSNFNRFTNLTSSSTTTTTTTSSVTTSTTNNLPSPKDKRDLMASEYEKQYSQYSCGQFSIFGELQSVVFHSLITSLES